MQIIESDSEIIIEHISTSPAIDSSHPDFQISDGTPSSDFSVFDTMVMYQETLTTQWMDISLAQQTLSSQLAIACLCHSSTTQADNFSFALESSNSLTIFNGVYGPESHEGHSCDECGGSIENGKCSKCGHAHHH